ncbi:uncharacterized protein FTOL_13948 [Fusarium torulosum]|uniref:Uncharacterized protein n=1 Tax=Fusarium torulosum TaxID=33205 RepID=A0AAE8MN23_9HYPO|nr:uncharacterized protein FTOL_13948 [Fusarium torulosum]
MPILPGELLSVIAAMLKPGLRHVRLRY